MEVEELEAKLAATQQALQKAASFGKQLADDNNTLRAQLQECIQKIQQYESVGGSISNGGLEGVEIRQKYEQLSREHDEEKQRVTQLETTIKEVLVRLESKETEVSVLESRSVELARQLEESENQSRSMSQKLKQTTSLADQAVDLNEEVEQLKGKLSESSQKEQSLNKLVTSLQERIATMQAQIDESHSQNQGEAEQLSIQVEKLKEELTSKSAKMSRLEALVATTEQLQVHSDELVESLNNMKEENEMLNSQLQVKDAVINQQKARIAQLQSQQQQASQNASLADQVPSNGNGLPDPATPTRGKSNLHALLVNSPGGHQRKPSTGTPSKSASPAPNAEPSQSERAAQEIIEKQKAQLDQMAQQQRQLMEALTKINLNVLASRPKPPGTRYVLLGNLPSELFYDPELKTSFEELMNVEDLERFRWVTNKGEFLGFCFVQLLSTEDADKAVSRNGTIYLNQTISIAYATKEEFDTLKPKS